LARVDRGARDHDRPYREESRRASEQQTDEMKTHGMSLSGWSAARGEAKDGPSSAAHGDAAPHGSSAARDEGAPAIDRDAEAAGEAGAEGARAEGSPRDDAAHRAAQPWAADREREGDERGAGAQVPPPPEEAAADGRLAVDPEPPAVRTEERDRLACDEE